MKKQKPIIFNTEMVKAILSSKKTQTRRPVKKPEKEENLVDVSFDLGYPASRKYSWAGFRYPDDPLYWKGLYRPGDILYVRETFANITETAPGNIHYKASASEADLKWFKENGWNWKPSIHMPKKYARIFLEVTEVRVERLQDITGLEIIKEGIRDKFENDIFTGSGIVFKEMWNKIYAKRGYGWSENPWVWVIEFKVE